MAVILPPESTSPDAAMTGRSMTERAHTADHRGGFRRWLVYLALVMTSVGSLAVTVGWLMPAYTNAVTAERIRAGQECEPGVPNTSQDHQCPDELWHSSMDNLRTNKWHFVDVGAGLLMSGLMWCGFLWWTRKRDLRDLSTPKSGLGIIALASMVWLLQIPAYDLLFISELSRGYLPPWADSITIPMSQVQAILISLFIPYLVIWLLFVVGARLPAPLFSAAPGRPLINAIWTGLAALLLVPVILVLIGAIIDGPTMMVPLLWLSVWLVLCARAAALSRHGGDPAQFGLFGTDTAEDD